MGLSFLAGGGKMAELMLGYDRAGTPLVPFRNWSHALRATVGLILPAQAEIVLFWGPDFVALYNDAYTPTIGSKHPRALGRPARENWSELWGDLEPLLRGVFETGVTFSAKDRPFISNAMASVKPSISTCHTLPCERLMAKSQACCASSARRQPASMPCPPSATRSAGCWRLERPRHQMSVGLSAFRLRASPQSRKQIDRKSETEALPVVPPI